MKTLILYATKYGAAREIAEQIAKKMDDAVLFDLKQSDIPDISEFDCIVIGSSVYAGSIHKEAKEFVNKNKDILLNKKFGLFLSGLGGHEKEKFFNDNFPQEILQAAKAKSFLGGIFDPKKTGLMERFIMKIVTKQSEYINIISEEKINKFIEKLKNN